MTKKNRVVHLFTVPKHWNQKQIRTVGQQLYESLNEGDGKSAIITKSNIIYTPIVLEEGDTFEVKRESDE